MTEQKDIRKQPAGGKQVFFPHPFSRAYWHQAALEVKDLRMLIFAAMVIALRVIFKQISIPIGPELRINTAFIINALGAMVMGPVLSLLCAAVTDTLGALLFPTGPYFFPFIFVEMAGSLVFALFLYRAELKPWRIIASRFCICLFVNIGLQTPIMMLYYQMILGKYYAPFDLLRIVKNLALFPLESLVLMIIFRPMVPALRKMGFAVDASQSFEMTRKRIALIVVLTVISVASAGGGIWYIYNTTSLSASYTAEERLARNLALGEVEKENHPELAGKETVCIIEAAYPKAFSPEVRYEVAVYEANTEGAEDPEALLQELSGLSKSKAAAREELTLLFRETVTLTDEHAKEPEKRPGAAADGK